MKIIKVTALAAILATALIFANSSPAEAKAANTDDNLSPKSFGLKSNHKLSIEKTYSDKFDPKKQLTKPDKLKPEQLKAKLKMIEAQKALEFAKKKYGI
jgi:hypothetical protein